MKTGYKVFMIITIVLTVSGLITLLPYGSASEKSMMGYKALCSFAPLSTLICFVLAGVSCKIRRAKFV